MNQVHKFYFIFCTKLKKKLQVYITIEYLHPYKPISLQASSLPYSNINYFFELSSRRRNDLQFLNIHNL